MLRVSIPAYRLPADVIDSEYSILEKMGVEIKLNKKVGEDISFIFSSVNVENSCRVFLKRSMIKNNASIWVKSFSSSQY